MRHRIALPVFILLFASLLGGCARYEFDLMRPADLAQHVGSERWVTASIDPLEYRMISREGHLVLHIFNAQADAIMLLGSESSIVDPSGQSHSLPSRTIAPNSYIKLILPPVLRAVPTGPRIGIGIGGGFATGSLHHHGRYGYYGGFHDPFWPGPYWYDEPRYYAVMVDSDVSYWTWEDEGSARLMLTYRRLTQQGESATRPSGIEDRISHELVVARRKM